MRRFIKPALVTLGAAAAAFAVVSQTAVFNPAPAAKASTFCAPESDARIINPVPFDITFPTLPTIPPIEAEIPCVPLPTIPSIPAPTVLLPTIPPVSLPTLEEILANIPREIDVPIPNPFPTTTTTNNCFATADAVVGAAC